MAKAAGLAGLAKNASVASWAVRDLNRSMLEFEQTGQISARTLSSLVGLLVRIDPALGAVAEAGWLVYEMWEAQKQQKVADAIDTTSTAFKGLNENMTRHEMEVAAAVGKYPELKQTYADIAQHQYMIGFGTRVWNEYLKEQQDILKDHPEKLKEVLKNLQDFYDQTVGKLGRVGDLDQEQSAIDKLERKLPLMQYEIQLLHEKNTAEIEIQQKAREQDTQAGGLIRETKIDAEIARTQQQIQQLEHKMRLEEDEGILQTENGKRFYAAQVQELDGLETMNERLLMEKRILNDVNQELMNAIQQTGVGVVDAYYNAIDKTISITNLLSDSTGRAMRNVAAQVLKSLGEQAEAKALMALADGLVALALGDDYTFGLDMAAFGIYQSIALLAGVGGAALSVGAGGGGKAPKGGAGNASQPPLNINVTVIGTLDAQQAEDLYGQLSDAAQQRRLV